MNLSNREYQEKRDFIRMRIDSPVDVVVAEENKVLRGICHDLSGGGMLIELIEVDTALPTGTEVEVTLTSSHGHSPVLRATATVTRISSQQGPSGTYNRVGLRLKDILA